MTKSTHSIATTNYYRQVEDLDPVEQEQHAMPDHLYHRVLGW